MTDLSIRKGAFPFDEMTPEEIAASNHELISKVNTFVERIAAHQAELQSLRANKVWSDEVTAQKVKAKQAEIDHDLDVLQQLYADDAQAEFDKLTAARDEVIVQNRLADPLNKGNGVQQASIELDAIAQTSPNLAEFMRIYEATKDPYLKRAYQLKGAALARRRWASEPQNGTFARRLDRDRAAYYENDDTRLIDARLQRLKGGVDALATASHKFFTDANGVAVPGRQTHTRRITELQWAIGEQIDKNAAAPAVHEVRGLHGGLFTPQQIEVITEER